MINRKFQCATCGNTFEVLYGTGGVGADMACPKCGALTVHRAAEDRGYARGGPGRGPDATGRGRGGAGRGPRWAQ
jgi:hypothetical protein